MSDRFGSETEIDASLKRLVERSKRPGAVHLWNLFDRGEREAATRWFVRSEEDGRRQIDEAVAAALRFRPQTVRRWPLDKIARHMGTVPLHDPALARLLLLHSVDAPQHVPMVRAFLDALGIPHEDGEVDSVKKLDASRYSLGKVAARMAEEYGDRTVALYFLVQWVAGAPLGEKSCAWLRERWGLDEPRDRGTEGIIADPHQREGEAEGEAGGDPRSDDAPEAEGEPASRERAPATRQASLTELDRLLERALEDCARGTLGALNEDEIDDAIDEFVTLNGTRHESYFHTGYRDVLFDRSMGESVGVRHPARLRWYWTGAVRAWAMRERWDRIAREYDENSVLRELASGSGAASAAAVLPIVESLRRADRTAEIGRVLTDRILIREPGLFEPLLSAATDLLHQGDAAHARHIFDLLVGVGDELEERGTAPEQRILLDARRRFAHSLRVLHEHERARQLLDDLLQEDPDPNTHAMVHADLGLMAGGFDSLEDVGLPTRRNAVDSVRDRLGRGEDHFRQSVREGTEYSAHGHYCLGVLALARTDDERAERHLGTAHMHFSKRPRSYARLVARSSLYAAIAKARQLQPDKLELAAKVIADALASGTRFPIHLVRETVDAFELADDKKNLRRVTEAIIEAGDDRVLDELAESASALRHCPLLAERLHRRSGADGRHADLKAADLRSALRGHMHAQGYARARDALDELERLALEGVASLKFQELLTDPAKYDPAWTREDAAIARAHCHEAHGEFLEATSVLREVFFRLMAKNAENSLDDAGGLLQRIYAYSRDRSQCSDMTDRYEAEVGGYDEPTAGINGDPAPAKLVRVLIVGGAERQARAEEATRRQIKRRHPHIRPKFIYAGWGSKWERPLADFEREVERHDALVILRFIRTNLGRQVRQRWPGARPWRFCWGGGPSAIAETAAKAAAALGRG